jgi:hypothetical protein
MHLGNLHGRLHGLVEPPSRAVKHVCASVGSGGGGGLGPRAVLVRVGGSAVANLPVRESFPAWKNSVQTVFSVGVCPSTMATAVPTGRGGYAEILWSFWTGESWFEGLSLVVDASAPRAET